MFERNFKKQNYNNENENLNNNEKENQNKLNNNLNNENRNNYSRQNYNNRFNYKNNYKNNRYDLNKNKSFNLENITHDHTLCGYEHEHSFLKEIFCHFPIALISLSFSILIVIFFEEFLISNGYQFIKLMYLKLFHISHYIHILFASMSSLIMFLRFSKKNYIIGSIFSLISSLFFCTVSDIILPTLSSSFFSQKILMHICFFEYSDAKNIIIFSFLGILGALSINFGNRNKNIYISNWLHSAHVSMSCLAALFYLLSKTNFCIILNSGYLILILTFSVLFPCVLSDTLIPSFIGKLFFKKNNIYDQK